MTEDNKLKVHLEDDEISVKMTIIMDMLEVNNYETNKMIDDIIEEYLAHDAETKNKINDLIKIHIDNVFNHLLERPLMSGLNNDININWIKRIFAFVKYIIATIHD